MSVLDEDRRGEMLRERSERECRIAERYQAYLSERPGPHAARWRPGEGFHDETMPSWLRGRS